MDKIRMRYMLWWILAALTHNGHGQDTLKDSLNMILNRQELSAGERASVLVKIANEHARSNPDSGQACLNQAMLLIDSLSLDSLRAKALIAKSNIYGYKGVYDIAIPASFEALDWAIKLKDSLSIYGAYVNLGVEYMYQDEYDRAQAYYENARDVAIAIGARSKHANTLNNLGILYGYRQDYDKEMALYQEALAIFRTTDDREGVGNTLLNIGTVYDTWGQHDLAKEKYLEALQVFKSIKYQSAVGMVLESLSENSLAVGNNEQALAYAFEALEIFKANDNLLEISYSYELLTKIYEALGNYKQQANYLKRYHEAYLRVFDQEKTQLIENLHVKYQTAKKEQEIMILSEQNLRSQAELEKRRAYQLSITVVSLLTIAIALYIYYSQKQRHRLEQQALQGEVSELRVQIMELLGKYEGQLDMDIDTLNQKLVNPLSQREFDVFEMIYSHKTNTEIAEALFVSTNTVKTHLKNIYSKLGVTNRHDALDKIIRATSD